MKIVFVSQPLSTGGAERVVAALANRFYEIGHEVKIVVVNNGDKNIYYTHSEIEFIYIDKPTNPILDLFHRIKLMRNYFKNYQPDVILSFTTQKNVSTLLATLFTKHTVIISERSNPYKDPKNFFLRILRKILYFTSDGFVFQTKGAMEFFSNKIQKRSCIIENPLSEGLPLPWTGKRKKNIVMVNRIDSQKNIFLAIDAFSKVLEKHPDYCLEIYGKGPLQKNIENYISSKNLSNYVFLRGFCSNVHEKIIDAGIYLLTSNFEGMSNSLMEALAIGLPCISTNHPTGGAEALIRNYKNGILVPVGNVDACIAAILKLIENSELAENLSKEAVKIRNELTVCKIADKWISYINEIRRN